MIKNNLILNCPMTLDDIERASKIYGSNIAALKGKTVRTNSETVISDYIAVPEDVLQANRNVTFSADIMFVNKILFFKTVSREIKFTTVEGIEARTIKQLADSTNKVRALYSARGFKLTNANLDGEFIPMCRHLQEMGIIGNFDTQSEHVPEIEQQIRVLKERARACRHTLPFQYLPRLIVIEMMNNCALWQNVFPPKGGVSTISPRILITGVKFDYTKHCKLPFGAYAQVQEVVASSSQTPIWTANLSLCAAISKRWALSETLLREASMSPRLSDKYEC